MQDYLDQKLIKRLLRPIERPGVINTGIGWEIVGRSQKFTNRLPLLSHITQRWNRKIGFQDDRIPIVYAQPQPQITAETGNISAELSQSSRPPKTVVQAKFAPAVSNLSTVPPKEFPIQGEGSQTTNSVGWVSLPQAKKTSELGVPIPEPNLQSLSANRAQKNPTMETPSNSQTTVVQAKVAPAASHLSSLTPNPNPIQGEASKSSIPVVSTNKKEESQTTNSVGLVEARTLGFDPPNETSELGVPISEPNLQSLSANQEQKNLRMETPSNSQTTVVQAKVAPAASHLSSLNPNPNPIQGEGSKSAIPVFYPNNKEGSQTTNLAIKPNNTKMLGGANSRGFAIAQPNLQINPMLEASARNQPTIVQAKFATASDRGILSPNPNPADFSLETQPKSDDFKLEETIDNPKSKIQNPKSKIQNSIGWFGLETPLVFSNPGVNTESAKPKLAVPNPGITGISRTEGITQTAGLSQEVSPAIQSDETSNIQPDRQDKSNVQNSLDLELLTDKIERKLMQRLIVESERRGKNIWS